MTRRARGDGGLSWDDKRQRWIAAVTVGYDGRRKRVFRRASGRTKTKDTKTKKSRRTLALPGRCIEALRKQRAQQVADRLAAGERWRESCLVFTTALGTAMDAANVRRDFRCALGLVPGLDSKDWTPRELRHSFVSLLFDAGVPVEEISRLVGHSGTSVTELVYRHQIRPVIQTGATAMVGSLPVTARARSYSVGHSD